MRRFHKGIMFPTIISQADSQTWRLSKGYWATHTKSVGVSCYSSHASRLWHRLFVETSNTEAHADMYINNINCIEADNGCLQIECRILHTHERLCCNVLDC